MKAKSLVIEKWINAPDGFDLEVEDDCIKIINAFQM